MVSPLKLRVERHTRTIAVGAGASVPGPDDLVTGSRVWLRLARFGIRPLLVGLDLVAVVIGILVAEYIGRQVEMDSPARKTALFGVLFVLLIGSAGLNRSRLSVSVLDDLPVILGRWIAAAGLAILGQVVWSQALWQDYIVNWLFLWSAAVIGALVIVLRGLGYAAVRMMRGRGYVTHSTIILGAGEVGSQVASILRSHPECGLRPVGFLDDDPRFTGDAECPVLGGVGQLTEVLTTGRVQSVIVAFSSMKESELVGVIRTCDRYDSELFVVPRLYELHHVDNDMDSAWGLPLVRLRRATYRSRAWRLKRLIDIAVSGGALLFIAPVMLLIALAVRLDGGPGIIFRQQRIGVDGRCFDVLKFRSLRPATEDESATRWNIAHDDRLSPVGRLLRKTSLDELPQLVNILRGDMSLVGPRPERPHFVDQFRQAYPSYEARHRVPSGLTGWAQVNGLRGDTSIADRARFDNYYIENWSLWLDVKIIMRTFSSVLRGAGG
jgi:exopolysaccharide biosynthesis polyprenyl glycosylphosphotransferase